VPTRRGSIRDKINHNEIEAKLIVLVSRLRGGHEERIRRATAEYAHRRLTTKGASRRAAFIGGTYSEEEVYWQGRLRAEVSFLSDYTQGVGRVYEEYFRRLGIPLTSENLKEVWECGIKPQWETWVEEFRRRIGIELHDAKGQSDLARRLIDAYQGRANEIRKDAFRTWQIKVEEAISTERFQYVASKSRVKSFTTPDGTAWGDVSFRFTSDFQVEISVRGSSTEVRNYTEMGFEDRRGKVKSKPDRSWERLRGFAEQSGEIQSTRRHAKDWSKLEKSVQTINQRLKSLFGFSQNPISYDTKLRCYKSMFKIAYPGSGEGEA
jgi:hypothetical protein